MEPSMEPYVEGRITELGVDYDVESLCNNPECSCGRNYPWVMLVFIEPEPWQDEPQMRWIGRADSVIAAMEGLRVFALSRQLPLMRCNMSQGAMMCFEMEISVLK